MSIMPGYPVPRSQWATSGEACTACRKQFSFFTAKENCPCCGRLFCSSCLSAECTLTPMGLPSAICLECFQKIQDWRRINREQQRQKAMQAAAAAAAVPTASASPSPSAAESRLAALESTWGRLQLSGRQLREESDSVVQMLAAKDASLAALTEQQRQWEAERDAVRHASEQAQQQVRTAAAARTEAMQALREVQEKLSASQESGAAMSEKMEALREANAILKSRLQAQLFETRDAQTSLQSASAEVAQLQGELASLAARSTAAETERDSLRASVASYEKERRAQEEETQRLMEAVAELEAQLRRLQQRQVEDNESSQGATAALAAEQQERLQEHVEESDALRATIASLEAQLSRAELQSSQDRTACAEAESRVAALEQEVRHYSTKESEWSSIQQAHTQSMDALRATEETATRRSAEAQRQLQAALQQSESAMAVQLTEKQRTIDTLTSELRSRQDSVEDLEVQVASAQQSVEALRDELRQAEEAAEAKLSTALAKITAKCDAACASLLEREAEAAALREECTAAHATYEAERRGWQSSLSELRAALAATEQQRQQHEQEEVAAAAAPGPLDRTSRWSRPTRVSALVYAPSELHDADGGIPAVAGVERWEFDTKAEAARLAAPDALVRIGYQIALDWLLFPNAAALQRWVHMLDTVQRNYHDNPYHNKVHAADILQGVYALVLQCPGLLSHMTKMEKRAVAFAAAVHDVRHPGRTEAFLKHTFDSTYFGYTGCRVLEQMHTATAFQLLGHADLDFTRDDMDDAEALRFHDLVASLIAVTYMGSHGALMQMWSQPLREGGAFDLAKESDRHTVLGMLLHAADIGAQSRGVDVAVKWLGVVEEMYQQGDEEAALGLPVSPGMSRGGDLQRGQIFFMEMFVIPLFDLVHQHFPSIAAPLHHLRTLHAHYSAATQQPQRPFPPPVAYAADVEKAKAAAAAEAADAEHQRAALAVREEGVARRERTVEQAVQRLRDATATVAQREAQLAEQEAQLAVQLSEKQRTIDTLTSELRSRQDSDSSKRLSQQTEEGLHRAAAAVVQREATVQQKAAELEAVTAELEQREAITSQLSSQLAAIAERVNRRRQLLRYREAQVRTREAALAAAALRRGSSEEQGGAVPLSHNGSQRAPSQPSPQLSPAPCRTTESAKLKSALEKLSSAMSFM